MKCTILQPTYLPWIGYFEMISATDTFVIYDHVQFVRKSWQQRNQIKGNNGIIMLSIPVQHEKQDTKISEMKISYESGNSLEKHWRSIELSYKKAKYFKEYEIIFKDIYSQKYVYLKELNIKIIQTVCELLGINSKIISSSTLGIEGERLGKNEDVINLCKKIGANYIYDAKGAESFLDASVFEKNGVTIKFQEYAHPTYNQLWGNFTPYMSVIDLLFNEGERSLAIIKSGARH